jgi:hypothetical protein
VCGHGSGWQLRAIMSLIMVQRLGDAGDWIPFWAEYL